MSIFTAGIAAISFLYILARCIHYKNLYTEEHLARLNNVLVDLDLATSDQLLQELRKRSRPLIILIPLNDTISIECHSISKENAAAILQTVLDESLSDESSDFR